MPKFEEIAHEGRCDVCGKQTNVAVCASSCGPISLAYCRSCLEAGLEPYGIMLAYISGAGHWPAAYTGPRAPSARSISPTLPERSPTIPRAVLEERPCQPRRRAEPGISHRSRGWGCRWQSKQSPVIECDSGKSVIPPAWHRRFPRIPVPLHAGSSNPIQGHRGNRRD